MCQRVCVCEREREKEKNLKLKFIVQNKTWNLDIRVDARFIGKIFNIFRSYETTGRNDAFCLFQSGKK